MALNGLVTVTLILDDVRLSRWASPGSSSWACQPTGRGERALVETMEADLDRGRSVGSAARCWPTTTKLEEEIRKVVRQVAMEEIGKKPEVTVVISRLVAE